MPWVGCTGVAHVVVSGRRGTVASMQVDEGRWLGCVVCGDDSEFIAIAAVDHSDDAEDELMCSRCGQARLVPILGVETVQRSA